MIKVDGYDYVFDENACKSCGGRCCTGESGYIFINDAEIERLANHLNISKSDFIDTYLYKVGFRYSIKEKVYKDGYACVFFENGCSVYKCRPTQCRTFPFWEYFKTNKEELKKECPGIKFF